jgi:transposase-like protein
MDGPVAVVADDVQVVAKPRRRTYTAEYKPRILNEADACATPGAVGALLRREGLYSSHLVVWRRARDRGERAALAPKKRGASGGRWMPVFGASPSSSGSWPR